jgi:hypothetical protein
MRIYLLLLHLTPSPSLNIFQFNCSLTSDLRRLQCQIPLFSHLLIVRPFLGCIFICSTCSIYTGNACKLSWFLTAININQNFDILLGKPRTWNLFCRSKFKVRINLLLLFFQPFLFAQHVVYIQKMHPSC